MSGEYPESLINELIAYFKNKRDLDISVREAEIYLDSLADLYDSLQSMV